MSLREAIAKQHDAAEKHPLTAVMLAGNLTSSAYADLLANQLSVYSAIEVKAKDFGISLPGYERAEPMHQDLQEMLDDMKLDSVPITRATEAQLAHIEGLDRTGIVANIYAHHMADMYGGQILKDKLPGKCLRYDFNNRSDLIASIRAMLTDDMAEEAKLAFGFTLQLFDDVADKHGIRSA